VQLEEERRVAEEEYENLRDEYINETTIMKGTIDHLQHENDTLAKSLDTLEKRCQEEKDRLEKK
jgi:dynactin complex subunit